MKYVWTEEKLEDYVQASEFTAFHKKLSVLAEPFLDERWTLADIGSGPGLLDFFIAPMVKHIYAIDSDPEAVKYLEARLDAEFYRDRSTAEKIEPMLKDARELGDLTWDALMLSYFGVDGDLLGDLLGRTKERALIFIHGQQSVPGFQTSANESESEDGAGKMSVHEIEAYLNENYYTYKKTEMMMEFGQPFRTIEDIHRFLDCMGLGGSSAEDRIIRTDRFDFPYYLPKEMHVVLFIAAMGNVTER